jgi:mRNA-degrading endonuclease RelE of RelBE toxin-antitoxin system
MAYANFSNYKIIFSKTAEKFLDKLDLKTKQHILLKIKELKTNNQNLDIKNLNHVIYYID